jgi:hypothetical protein
MSKKSIIVLIYHRHELLDLTRSHTLCFIQTNLLTMKPKASDSAHIKALHWTRTKGCYPFKAQWLLYVPPALTY